MNQTADTSGSAVANHFLSALSSNSHNISQLQKLVESLRTEKRKSKAQINELNEKIKNLEQSNTQLIQNASSQFSLFDKVRLADEQNIASLKNQITKLKEELKNAKSFVLTQGSSEPFSTEKEIQVEVKELSATPVKKHVAANCAPEHKNRCNIEMSNADYIARIFNDVDYFAGCATMFRGTFDKKYVTALKKEFRDLLNRNSMLEHDLKAQKNEDRYEKLANNGQVLEYWDADYFSNCSILTPSEKESVVQWIKNRNFSLTDDFFMKLGEPHKTRYELWKKHNRMVHFQIRCQEMETIQNDIDYVNKQLKDEQDKSEDLRKINEKALEENAELRKENGELWQKLSRQD